MLHIEKITSKEVALFDEQGVRKTKKSYSWISSAKWQYRIVRKDYLFGIIKCVGNDVIEIVAPCSNHTPDTRKLIEYGITILDLNDGLALINTSGRRMLSNQKKIFIVNDNLVVTQELQSKQERYRLYNPLTKKMTSKSYTDFELHEKYIQTFDGISTGILNWDFQEELSAMYSDAYPWGDVYKGITPSGKEVVGSAMWDKPSVECTKIFPESHGFFRAYGKAKRYGFISAENGRSLTQFIYTSATDFGRNNIAQVECPGNIWKYLDKYGKILEENHII